MNRLEKLIRMQAEIIQKRIGETDDDKVQCYIKGFNDLMEVKHYLSEGSMEDYLKGFNDALNYYKLVIKSRKGEIK